MKYKSQKTAVAILVSLLVAALAQAHTVRSTKHCGTVESIDRNARTMVIACETHKHTSEVRLQSWPSVAPGASLKAGDKACVYFRQPFFGKPFATKVATCE